MSNCEHVVFGSYEDVIRGYKPSLSLCLGRFFCLVGLVVVCVFGFVFGLVVVLSCVWVCGGVICW